MRKEPAMKLERSPLVLVLSQVRFSPVALMEEFVPQIQDALRKEGFVWFDEEQMQEIVLGPKASFKGGKRWLFTTRERDEAVVLTDRFLVYETVRYDVFETFVEKLKTALRIVREVADIALSEQLGLRYVDLIEKVEGKSPRELLQKSVQGLTDEQLGTTGCRHQSLAMASTPHGKIHVRTIENSGSNVLPPDLGDTRLDMPTRRMEEEPFRILDIDHISALTRDFDPDLLIKAMWDLHEYTKQAFRATVTKEAIDIWKKGENA